MNTDKTIVYVRLLDEGTMVFRPASVTVVGPDTVVLLAPDGYDPEIENWEFKPGSVVRIEQKKLAGGEAYVAVSIVGRGI